MQPDMAQLARVLQSPEGQQLMQLLQNKEPEMLSKAAAQANAGNAVQAGRTLAPLLRDPEIRRLLDMLGGNL